MIKQGILVHDSADDVGVAVTDLRCGSEAGIMTLEGTGIGTVTVVEDIPLGHKVALNDMPAGHGLLKYGRAIGQSSRAIRRGAHVHTHNLKTQRWKA